MKGIYFASFYFRVCDLTRKLRENENLTNTSTYTVMYWGQVYLKKLCFSFFFFFFFEGFQETSHTHHTHSVQQQALAAAVDGLHTKMEMLQLASENMQQTVQSLEPQVKQGMSLQKRYTLSRSPLIHQVNMTIEISVLLNVS